MSYWTVVDFEYVLSEDDWDTPEFLIERERDEIELLVAAEKYHPDVTRGIYDLVTKKEAGFKLNSYLLIELFSKLAARFPNASFAVRGRGEAIRDIWLREYVGGKNTLALGPPEGAGL